MTNVWNREASVSTEILRSCVMLCAIWCHLYNLKRKNIHGGLLLLVKLQAAFHVSKLQKCYQVAQSVS